MIMDVLKGKPSTSSKNVRFQWQYWDEETGLHYNFNRYYDSGIGRYLTQDPIKLTGGMNSYRYCNNPISEIDSLGLINLPKGHGQNAPDRLSSTGGRNTEPLTPSQVDEATNYAKELGFEGPIYYRPLDRGYNTSYSDLDWLMISDDLYPNINGVTANSRMSWRAALSHEIVDHAQANLAGKSFEAGSLLEEVQASVRASRLTLQLTSLERYQLRRDAVERIQRHNLNNNESLRWRDLKDKLWLEPLE